VIICCNRHNFPARLTQEDFDIQQSKVPKRARFIYMLGDSTDAEIMFAWVDAAADRTTRQRKEIDAAALADAHRMYERQYGKPFP
jgi:hypothetical protein